MKIIFVFIDGFGLGEKDPDRNPIYAANAPVIQRLLGDENMIPTDTTLGVPGLPQSATGQTAIFTGVNAPKVLGHHMSGQPSVTLKKIINESNLFKELMGMGLSVTNSNVYRDEYLAKMLDPQDWKNRPSVTSVMTMSAGLNFRTVEDYKRGLGVYHDITGKIIYESGYDIMPITPAEAARRLYRISREYDFTLFEHFMTDIIGHKGDLKQCAEHIELLDSFLGELISMIDPEKDLLIITSDHGNIEDASVKTHTYNKVPTVLIGNVPLGSTQKVNSIMDITPLVVDIFRAYS